MGKPGDACRSSVLTHTEMNEEDRGGRVKEAEWEPRESCGLCWIFAGEIQRAEREAETDKHTWTDGDLERD